MQIELIKKDQDRRVDVTVDGRLFTSYFYSDDIMKPVLFPIYTSEGTLVTRGYPYMPIADERVDHPHHLGMWFNYGNVNGLDFWNNSSAIPEEKKEHYGRIRHQKITGMKSGDEQAELSVTMSWQTPDGKELLREDTTFVFRPGMIDRCATLTATNGDVEMPDDKEGVFGIRVTRALEAPAGDKPDFYTGADGKRRAEKTVADGAANGVYCSSEGVEGDAVWGTRGNWVALRGICGGQTVSLVIIDHPDNPGHPTYWHARGYGLFAANPLGQGPLSGGKDKLDFRIPAGESVSFKYRTVIDDSGQRGTDDWNQLFHDFASV